MPYRGASGGMVDIGARVYNDADIEIPNNAPTMLTFNQERWDTDTIHDAGVNPGRLTATTAGTYLITGNVSWEDGGVGLRQIYIRLNGATIIGSDRRSPIGTGPTICAVSTTYILAATHYVELGVFHTQGAALDVDVLGNYSPEFMMQLLVL